MSLDAVVTAAGRLPFEAARRYGTDVKALVRIGDASMLARLIGCLRLVPAVARIVVVGPSAVRRQAPPVDEWVDESSSGERNIIAALAASRTQRTLYCASDLPFVSPQSVAGLMSVAPKAADVVYPIVSKASFCAHYPGARASFVRLADGQWTGASVFIVNAPLLLRKRGLLARAFASRKRVTALAGLLGPDLLLRYIVGRATVPDVERRAGALLQGSVAAVTGIDPALAMDCDTAADIEYARRLAAAPYA
ncbi:MAG: NTP transferase domain-containing protein [Candidatus Eremiobacteraeota bacterium]|nr:NTP transferase domain-containing protein [Candidatus Eremiobacteraeota bacterium]